MSSERASSAVHNLRSIFETKPSDNSSPDTRGRSRGGLPETENSRPTSKVRASFVSVEPSGGMAASLDSSAPFADLKRQSSAGLRRGSFGEKDGDEGLLELKKTVSREAERRERDPKVAEAIPENAAESLPATPNTHAENNNAHATVEESLRARVDDQEPVNPDKPTTGAEEEPSDMQPADLTSVNAVSGGEALPPVAEDLRPSEPSVESARVEPDIVDAQTPPAKKMLETASSTAKKAASRATPSGKPSPLATKASSKPTPNVLKSPASQRTPSSTSAIASKAESPRTSTQTKSSRSSLTAPTASSVAKATVFDKRDSHPSESSKLKPREGTKPINLPTRLTAPTAASKARHDPSIPSASASRSTTASKPRPPPASTKPTPRSSLAPGPRSESRTSQASSRRTAPADGSFLERMMRPTAASANKTHDKVDPKSPPRTNKTAAPPKPRANGLVKKPAAKTASRLSATRTAPNSAAHELKSQKAHDDAADAPNDTPVEDSAGETPAESLAAPSESTASGLKTEESIGNETPLTRTNGDHVDDRTMEATPAFGGQDETIR